MGCPMPWQRLHEGVHGTETQRCEGGKVPVVVGAVVVTSKGCFFLRPASRFRLSLKPSLITTSSGGIPVPPARLIIVGDP